MISLLTRSGRAKTVFQAIAAPQSWPMTVAFFWPSAAMTAATSATKLGMA
jgi:hypothetical protein